MAKRSIEETFNEDSRSEFKYDDSDNQLRKKIKLEIDAILNKVAEIDKEIDINEHEVHKFPLIFHTLAERVNCDQPQEETDGFVTDTILQIVNIIAGLLKNNIDSLNIPAVLRNALKKLKRLHKQKTQRRVKRVWQSHKMPRIEMRPRRPARPAGVGQKNNDRIRIRNRRYKIKRFLAQPKNIDVKQNGRVVRRMVVRRQTIYPNTRRRREY